MTPRARDAVRDLQGYTPGEQPAAGVRVVKLNTNEAAFEPPGVVVEAVREAATRTLRKYPDPRATELRHALARRHGLTPDNVLVGNGSDDVLTILLRTFVPDGGRVAFPWPTYSLYPTLARIQGAIPRPVPYADGWALQDDALAGVACDARSGCDAVFVVNPNAPSGTFVEPARLAELARRVTPRLFVVDEAYGDYAPRDFVPFLEACPNAVVTRSFSKGFALAGVRLGYALGHVDVIAEMDKVRDSYNVDALAQAAGVAAIQANAAYDELRREVVVRRGVLTDGLTRRGFLVAPSQANFVFARVPQGRDAHALYLHLKERGVLVRHFTGDDLDDHLRITVGTDADHHALFASLDALS